jgi:cytidyltransferase-like protein
MKTIVVASGYFNPLHVGHLSYLKAARTLGDELWVIVNNDTQVALKGSTPFMCIEDRAKIVSELECVKCAFYSIDNDLTVCETLALLKCRWFTEEHVVFANGGDRINDNVPEKVVCDALGIDLVFGVGGGKVQSSSNLLNKVKRD